MSLDPTDGDNRENMSDARSEGACDNEPREPSRRDFLQLLGASIALAGLEGCTRAPLEKIVPFATEPPELVPGVPLHYATAMTVGGYAKGLLVESHEGRPTKVEGNPRHPASLGATGVIEQASVLSLYDPSRARGLHGNGLPRSYFDFIETFGPDGRLAGGFRGGEGLHVLLEPTSSPTTIALLERLRQLYPATSIHFYAALARDAAWRGAALAFGEPLDTLADLKKADVVVALDANFLAEGPNCLKLARDFAGRRRVRKPTDSMNRLYVVESTMSPTGGMADHRLRMRRSDIAEFALALLSEISAAPGSVRRGIPAELRPQKPRPEHGPWLAALARDLRAHAGRSAILVGDGQPPLVHALAHLANSALGNIGQTITLHKPAIYEAGSKSHDLSALLSALDAGTVAALFILGGNPVYTTPVDAEFARRMALARERIYLGLYDNETARAATWFVPEAHYLESWGDARAFDGTASIVQPLIEPLYQGKTSDELLATLMGVPKPSGYTLVRDRWRTEATGDFDALWERALQAGVIDGTASPDVEVAPDWAGVARAAAATTPVPAGLEISFTEDPCVRDGAFANNAWLLELPDPVTKLTWGNALLIGPETAKKLDVTAEDLVTVTLAGKRVVAPVFVAPGHADDSVSLSLGYGRSGAETLAKDLGVNANLLRRANAPSFDLGVTLTRRGGKHALATTQKHWSLEGRDLIRRATLEKYKSDPRFAKRDEARPSLYKLPLAGADQWAMSIDLGACTGCNACVLACQAENNTPVVGEEGVLMHREMHWLRIDRYFEGPPSDPAMSMQPMLCQHCEKAPCEYVCPVNATVHSPDGLNEQVYNRCIGTRFCSNNCAWKVRRFNWFNYHELAVRGGRESARELHKMAMNPDVTVRERGVMEKCTYCVQRIRENEKRARISGVPLKDGDVVTACAQACASQAIVFGSLTMPGSRVRNLRQNDLDYAVLGELGTEPRTRYLARIDNPNPEIPR